MKPESYIIRGGMEGRERLRLIARITRPTTRALLERAGLQAGMRCLDAGCGGGDVSLELARLVGPEGGVLGIDLDEVKLQAARTEAAMAGRANVEFQAADIVAGALPRPAFDLVYARFLLTHLREPGQALRRLVGLLQPGGLLVVEDIDYRGHFIHPPSAAMRGEEKLVSAITMEAIADSVLQAGFATPAEVEEIVDELYRLGRDETTVMGTVRIVQTWGRKAA